MADENDEVLMFESLQDKLKIDRDNLDEELIQQPNNFFHAGQQHALAVSRRDRADARLDSLKATLDRKIREQAAADDEKITENQIKAAIARDSEFLEASKKYFAFKREADEWQVLKDSYAQRAYILKDLVVLAQIGYFGDVTNYRDRESAKDRKIYKRGN